MEAGNVFRHGVAKFGGPAGNYWWVSEFVAAADSGFTDRIVILPQFSVNHSTSLAVRERAASSKITVRTARPSAPCLDV